MPEFGLDLGVVVIDAKKHLDSAFSNDENFFNSSNTRQTGV